MHSIFIWGSLKLNIFKVLFWEGGCHKKVYSVYALDNVDNSGRPLSSTRQHDNMAVIEHLKEIHRNTYAEKSTGTTPKTTDIKFPRAMVKYTVWCFGDHINFVCSFPSGPSMSLFITMTIVKCCCSPERSFNTKLMYSVTGKQPERVGQPLTENCGGTMDRIA